jgi:phosphonate transport system substrate-binding protein
MLRPAWVLVLVACLGCSGADPSGTAMNGNVLRIAVLPDQSRDELERAYRPLLAHLEQATGIELELTIPASYEELIEECEAGNVQLGWFGGLAFLKAEQDGSMAPLVMRDVDLDFTSTFLVPSSSSATSLSDLGGGSIAFGSKLSTSGHLMPRHFLHEEGIDVDDFFREIRHTGTHDATAAAVRRGEVDVGALNSVVLRAMFDDGRMSDDDVRVIWRTPPYRDYVWAVSRDVEASIRVRLLDAFLALDPGDAEDAEVLRRLGASGFVPASSADFVEIRSVATEHGLLQGDSS